MIDYRNSAPLPLIESISHEHATEMTASCYCAHLAVTGQDRVICIMEVFSVFVQSMPIKPSLQLKRNCITAMSFCFLSRIPPLSYDLEVCWDFATQ